MALFIKDLLTGSCACIDLTIVAEAHLQFSTAHKNALIQCRVIVLFIH